MHGDRSTATHQREIRRSALALLLRLHKLALLSQHRHPTVSTEPVSQGNTAIANT